VKEVRVALARAMAATAVALGLVALVSGAIAWSVEGGGAAWTSVAGAGVAAFVGLSTQAAMLVGTRLSPQGLSATVLGSFAVKAIVLVLIFVAVRASDVSKAAFALPLVIGILATLVIDTTVLLKARVPHVAPGEGGEQG
jgi:hypothetical protein